MVLLGLKLLCDAYVAFRGGDDGKAMGLPIDEFFLDARMVMHRDGFLIYSFTPENEWWLSVWWQRGRDQGEESCAFLVQRRVRVS